MPMLQSVVAKEAKLKINHFGEISDFELLY